ncbi:MAG: glycosyltransferase family 4 protein [Gaiellaceae bacterium]
MRSVLIVGRTRYRLPLDPSLARKFDALKQVLDVRVIGSAPAGSPTGDETFRLVPPLRVRKLDGLAFHLGLAARAAAELRSFRPDAVLVQGAHEAAAVLAGRALARSDTKLILDIHGDWRTATRLYGSPSRRLLNPLADRLATFALRRADAIRTVSDYTTGLVREAGAEPAAVFPAFMDLGPFLDPPVPLPERPTALFIGVLELYKNIDRLALAWRQAAPQVPDACLHLVGRGSRTDVVEGLVRDLPEQTRWTPQLDIAGIAAALDAASALVLPSRSEGMGRVIVESLCRGRPVLGSRVGGIRDLVRDGENGLLVEPTVDEIAAGLVRLLGDRSELERLAAAARPSVEPWIASDSDYAERVAALVEQVAGRGLDLAP